MTELERLLYLVEEYQDIRMGKRNNTAHCLRVTRALDEIDIAKVREEIHLNAEVTR